MAETVHTEEKNLISNSYGIPRTLDADGITSIIQSFPTGTSSVIYFGDLDPTKITTQFANDSDVYIRTGLEDAGMVYQYQGGVWNPMVNITGPVGPNGADGATPYIDEETGHWMLNGVDTGVIGQGHDGADGQQGEPGPAGAPGVTPSINPDNGNWMIGAMDTGVYAHGKDGITPQIDPESKHWMIGEEDTNVPANGTDGITPSIDPNTKHWMIGDRDTGIVAEGVNGTNGTNGDNGKDGDPGQDGLSPHIDGPTGNWFIGEVNTGVHAEGPRGLQGDQGPAGTDAPIPKINELGNWQVGDTDTGIKAQGPQGIPGNPGTDGLPGEPGNDGEDGTNGTDGITPHIDEATNHWFLDDEDTGIAATGPAGKDGDDGTDGATPEIDPETHNWKINGVDTGVNAGNEQTWDDAEISSYISDILRVGNDPDSPGDYSGPSITSIKLTGDADAATGIIDTATLTVTFESAVPNANLVTATCADLGIEEEPLTSTDDTIWTASLSSVDISTVQASETLTVTITVNFAETSGTMTKASGDFPTWTKPAVPEISTASITGEPVAETGVITSPGVSVTFAGEVTATSVTAKCDELSLTSTTLSSSDKTTWTGTGASATVLNKESATLSVTVDGTEKTFSMVKTTNFPEATGGGA